MKKQLRLAGCILLDDDRRVLLLHRNTPKRTQWEIPGGKIEDGESEADTVVREIKEELGVDIRIERLLGARDFVEDEFTMSYHWFLAKVPHDKPKIGEPKTFDDLRYFSQDDMAAVHDELSANTRNFLDAWRAKDLNLDI